MANNADYRWDSSSRAGSPESVCKNLNNAFGAERVNDNYLTMAYGQLWIGKIK